MSDQQIGEVGMRVLLRGDHLWSGHTGTVLEDNGTTVKVRLHNGKQVLASAGQWKLLPKPNQRAEKLGPRVVLTAEMICDCSLVEGPHVHV